MKAMDPVITLNNEDTYQEFQYELDKAFESKNPTNELIEFYEEAGPDYAHWSPKYNMHFGYLKWGLNPFRREQMLEQMNREVLNRLKIENSQNTHILDAGCGMGASLRTVHQYLPKVFKTGISLVPWQIKSAKELTRDIQEKNHFEFLEMDFNRTPFAENSFNAAYAIEAACYGKGKDKREFVNEMWRVLKPGGRLVIADCFLKTDKNIRPRFLSNAYENLCKDWALTDMGVIGQVRNSLSEIGFTDIQCENISWKVAPSVMHVPLAVISFIFKNWIKGNHSLKNHSRNNLKASLNCIILGLSQHLFGYYLISAKKPG